MNPMAGSVETCWHSTRGAVRDLTDSEKAQCRRVWDEERRRLQPEMNRKKRRWLAKQGKKLAKCMPDASQEQIRAILEHRWSGNLIGSDVIILNGRKVPVAEILLNPDKIRRHDRARSNRATLPSRSANLQSFHESFERSTHDLFASPRG